MKLGHARIGLAALCALLVAGCGGHAERGTWTLPAADLAGTRDASGSTITARNVGRLRVLWRTFFGPRGGLSGIYASTPVVDANFVYVEDLHSNVFALDRKTGNVEWAHHYSVPNEGPNGLAVDGGRVYGATAEDVFALAELNGRELWRRHVASRGARFDIAPVPWQGLLFVSTVGRVAGGRGAIYALDAATGKVRWRFSTVARRWLHPQVAGGGGAWYPASVDAAAHLYVGTASPAPWGGSKRYPDGEAFPGPVEYTDSLLVLDASDGRLLWHDQVTPHDVRGYDFETTPVLAGARVVGAGKAGRVIAWSTSNRRRLWERAVGVHRHDAGPLPTRPVDVCPGLLGGVATPMAYARGRIFVPVVDLCSRESATTSDRSTRLDPLPGRGRFVALSAATGAVLWQHVLPSPDFGCAAVANDVVFTSSYDGTVYGFDTRTGALEWHVRLPAGIDACPAIAGNTLYVGAGVPLPGRGRPELVAFSLPR